MSTGRKLTMGPVLLTPRSPASQPHWKTATTAPRAAPTVSRKPNAALIGTTTERNTRPSNSSAKPTTTTTNTGSAVDSA